MALDTASQDFLAQMVANGGKAFHEMTPSEARAAGDELATMYGPAPKMRYAADHSVSVQDSGSITARVLLPHDSPRAVIVYYHGGGWVLGSINGHDTLARRLAQQTSAAVVLVGYRLAPEHPYPTAVEDAWSAARWAADHLETIAGGTVPLALAGDNAGANLATTVARRAHERQGPRIAMQTLVNPVTDASVDDPSFLDPDNQLLVTRETMMWFWDHYLPAVERREEADASPLRAHDLSGLPPTVIVTAEHDVLCDQGEAFARRLELAGVAVTLRRFEGQIHGFFTMVDLLPAAETGLAFVSDQIDRQLSTIVR